MKQHYVATAGLRGGYTPNYSEVHNSFESACESLIGMHDNGWEMLEGNEPLHQRESYGSYKEYQVAWVSWLQSPMYKAIQEFEEACENLRKFGFSDINLHIHGNEYMQIAECNCDEPWLHTDSLLRDVLDYLDYTEEEAREALKEAARRTENDPFVVEGIQDFLNLLARHVDVEVR